MGGVGAWAVTSAYCAQFSKSTSAAAKQVSLFSASTIIGHRRLPQTRPQVFAATHCAGSCPPSSRAPERAGA